MARDRLGELSIRKCGGRQAGFVQPGDVVPMTREPVATQPCLQAEDMDRRRLFPERPLGAHNARSRGGKFNRFHQARRVADDVARTRRLTG